MSARTTNAPTVLLSASLPDELKGTVRAQRLFDVLVVLSRALAGAGARLVFGGHPTITPVIDQAVARLGVQRDFLQLYQARHYESQVLEEILDQTRFPCVHWVGKKGDDRRSALTALRQRMAKEADAAILIGGRGIRTDTPIPGLREEYALFRAKKPRSPIYILGLLEGEALRMICEVEHDQIDEPNGLSREELQLIHHSDLIELIAPLIVRDLAGWMQARSVSGPSDS